MPPFSLFGSPSFRSGSPPRLDLGGPSFGSRSPLVWIWEPPRLDLGGAHLDPGAPLVWIWVQDAACAYNAWTRFLSTLMLHVYISLLTRMLVYIILYTYIYMHYNNSTSNVHCNSQPQKLTLHVAIGQLQMGYWAIFSTKILYVM